MKTKVTRFFVSGIFLLQLQSANAGEFEKLGTALAKALGTQKVFQSKIESGGKTETVFYSKDETGKPAKLALVQKGLYPPSCTHTWVVGLDAKTSKVEGIRVVEMSCPHAFPTNKAFFLDQYKGKGPADVATLKENIQTIAKATGTCNLTTTAVTSSINAAAAFAKGNL